nr:MAG TPA: hypothetical protein [Caudoviricetes sp.]
MSGINSAAKHKLIESRDFFIHENDSLFTSHKAKRDILFVLKRAEMISTASETSSIAHLFFTPGGEIAQFQNAK